MERRKTRGIQVGSIIIGDNNPIVVQSMCKTDTKDVKATVAQIKELEEAGCEIVRVAVPDMDSIDAFKEIKKQANIPVVADIHFNHKIAVESAKYADKLRINPGNIGSEEKLKEIIAAAKENNIPIRIGVNSGSLEKEFHEKYGFTAKAMVESALKQIKFFESMGFNNLIVSLKASDVPMTIEACKLFSEKSDYPLHIGITESGPSHSGTIKSSAGIASILNMGIGDTIRVSLTDNPVNEVRVAYEILQAMGLRTKNREIISCPTCGRTKVNLAEMAKKIDKATANLKKPVKIAVMGCAVNGPGEAKKADLGLAFGEKDALLFKKGEILRKVTEENAVEELLKEAEKL
ncbi:MAG: flavodoxin-dependent (E)-4-hydroxy-3-methylbut-2-enyl-diphosphate synthase [bacterium]|nr:flavodoxin-dependent (E)-4-hydroxy-3-methylbut-2-enyl-diphosphate synthase [bacterium]